MKFRIKLSNNILPFSSVFKKNGAKIRKKTASRPDFSMIATVRQKEKASGFTKNRRPLQAVML